MNKNSNKLKIALILIIISSLVSIVSIINLRVDKPVFLMNYCEIGTYENEGIYSVYEGSFNLQYIANVEDQRHVVGITFKEAPNTYFFASEYSEIGSTIFFEEDNSNVVKYGRYGVHTVYVSCPDFKYNDDSDELVLTEATLEFDDGLKLDVNLGKIVLYKEKNTPVALDHIGSKSSTDGLSSTIFKVKEDMKIEKVDSTLFEDASEVFDFNISTSEYGESREVDYIKDTTIKKDSIINFSSTYNGSNNILEDYTIYDIRPKIYFVNEYNDRYSVRYYNMTNNNLYYSNYRIFKYLKARGEL